MSVEKLAVAVGLFLLCGVVFLVALAPWLAPYSPIKGRSSERLLPMSREHLLGTDHFGRDIFSRILYGGQITLPLSFATMLLCGLLGTTIGVVAAWNYGNLLDTIIMRLVDVLLAMPFMVIAMAMTALFGRGLDKLLLTVVATWWASFARLARSLVLALQNSQAVMAAKVCGASRLTIARREILPNIMGPLGLKMAFQFSSLILSLSALSFLGLGSAPPTPEWGGMLSDGRQFLSQSVNMLLWPCVFIFLIVLGLNLIGEGMRDLMDPYEYVRQ